MAIEDKSASCTILALCTNHKLTNAVRGHIAQRGDRPPKAGSGMLVGSLQGIQMPAVFATEDKRLPTADLFCDIL